MGSSRRWTFHVSGASCLEPAAATRIYPIWDGRCAKVPSFHSEAHKLRRQVSTLSEFGKRALRSDDIDGLLQEATRLVSDAIDVELVKVLELVPGGENLLVRAGVNWNPGVVGVGVLSSSGASPRVCRAADGMDRRRRPTRDSRAQFFDAQGRDPLRQASAASVPPTEEQIGTEK
jgi:hypothetical protein